MIFSAEGLGHIQQQKAALRADQRQGISAFSGGKQAEMLRRQQFYRQASHVFVDLSPSLQQVRINCLLDGKQLVMPGPGLKDGFFHFKPFSIPFNDLAFAVSSKGLSRFGNRLNEAQFIKQSLDLMVTDALLIDMQGRRLGDGLGFFDLSHAILHTLGTAGSAVAAVCVCAAEQIVLSPIPTTCWDVGCDYIVSEQMVHTVANPLRVSGKIYWQYLEDRKIRKITPLWWIKKGLSAEG